MARNNFILVVGASAGGSLLLPGLVRQFTEDMDLVVLIVLHLSKQSVGEMLVNRLQKETAYTCKIPKHGEKLKRRHVFIARPDHHLMIDQNKILIGKGPVENRYRPSVDALFRSAAASHGNRVIGIILTGMLEDGAAGMLAIRRAGGICIIQDPNEASYPDMPRAVLNQLSPDYSVPVSEMGNVLSKVLSEKRKKKSSRIPSDIIKEARIAERVFTGINTTHNLGERSVYSCPDCGGGLWEITENDISRYRCHVGHTYSSDGLISGMEATTEAALWTALRIIEERKNLLKQIEEKEKKRGNRQLSLSYRKRAIELEQQVEELKRVLFASLKK